MKIIRKRGSCLIVKTIGILVIKQLLNTVKHVLKVKDE